MNGPIEQGWKDRLKVLRSAIRLKHALAADHQLNEVLDGEKKRYFKSVQSGMLPKPLDADAVKAIIGA